MGLLSIQVNQLDVLRLSSFLQKKKQQKQSQPTRQLLRRYVFGSLNVAATKQFIR